ncbi:sulfurase, partial [candidate division KSB1 bacterium]|nr:sulfurase [candidate division KSB1 bacterium]
MLEKIWIKRFKKGPMDSVRSAQLIAGKGIATNANIGGKRQVTILSAECWSTVMRDLGIDFDPSER